MSLVVQSFDIGIDTMLSRGQPASIGSGPANWSFQATLAKQEAWFSKGIVEPNVK